MLPEAFTERLRTARMGGKTQITRYLSFFLSFNPPLPSSTTYLPLCFSVCLSICRSMIVTSQNGGAESSLAVATVNAGEAKQDVVCSLASDNYHHRAARPAIIVVITVIIVVVNITGVVTSLVIVETCGAVSTKLHFTSSLN